MRLSLKVALLVAGVLCFTTVVAQESKPPLVEGEIEFMTGSEHSDDAGWTGVQGTIKFNSDGLGEVLDAIVGALCSIFPCGGSDSETQAVQRVAEQEIADRHNSMSLVGGGPGLTIGEFWANLRADSSYRNGEFMIRFHRDSQVQLSSITFASSTCLTEAYREFLGLRRDACIPAGTYHTSNGALRIPVR